MKKFVILLLLISFCGGGSSDISQIDVSISSTTTTSLVTTTQANNNIVYTIEDCLKWEKNFDEIADQYYGLMDSDYENKIGYIAGYSVGPNYETEDINYKTSVEPYINIDSDGYLIDLFDPFNNKYIKVHTYDRKDSFEQLSLDWGSNFLKEIQRYNAIVFPTVLPPPEDFKVSTLDFIELQKYYEKLVSYTQFAATPIYDPENPKIPLYSFPKLILKYLMLYLWINFKMKSL